MYPIYVLLHSISLYYPYFYLWFLIRIMEDEEMCVSILVHDFLSLNGMHAV
jgi:hypothetical protein